jgi:hypothetical protein
VYGVGRVADDFAVIKILSGNSKKGKTYGKSSRIFQRKAMLIAGCSHYDDIIMITKLLC